MVGLVNFLEEVAVMVQNELGLLGCGVGSRCLGPGGRTDKVFHQRWTTE